MVGLSKKKMSTLLEEWGAKHASFTSATHEYMSPLDNHAFGIAKGAMRGNEVPENDRMVPSLVFLKALDDIPAESIAAMWERNFMLSSDAVSREAAGRSFAPRGEKTKKREKTFTGRPETRIGLIFWEKNLFIVTNLPENWRASWMESTEIISRANKNF